MKKLTAALIIISFFLSFAVVPVSAAEFALYADELKAAGLFIGTTKGYELDRAPTRAEAAVMLVRLLGKESEANEKNYSHPFKDVEKWASPYVGYLYKNSLTNGVAADKFGSSTACDVKMFCAFVLRALGYSEAGGDFKYDGALDFARSIGLADDAESYKSKFTRDGCVSVMYNALFAKVKGTKPSLLLWEKLVSEKAVNEAAVKSIVSKTSLIQELNAVTDKYWTENGGIEAYTMKGSYTVKSNNASSGSSILSGFSMDMSIKMEYSASVLNKSLESASIYDIYTAGFPMSVKSYEKDGYIYSDMMGSKTKEKAAGTSAKELLFYPDLTAASVKSISKKSVDTGIEYTVALSEYGMGSISGGSLQYKELGFDGDMKNVVVTFLVSKSGKVENLKMDMDMGISGTDAHISADMKVTATGKDVKITFPDFSGYVEASGK